MNILYIDIDSLRRDHLGCYGYRRNTSPTIDRIASEGMRFENVYVSDVPCHPSRTALWSGRHGLVTGVVGHGGTACEPFREGAERAWAGTFYEDGWMKCLRDLGYHTATISSFGERHGCWHWYAGFNEVFNCGKRGMETAEEVVPQATVWLERRGKGGKWFLHVNLWDPHTPYRTPRSYGDPFAKEPLPAWLTAEPVERAKRILLSAMLCADGVLPTPRPDVVVEAVTPNGISYVARYWMNDFGRVLLVRDAVLTAVLGNLARAGIEPARPKQEIRRRQPGPPDGGSLRRGLLRQLELFDAFDDKEVDALAQAMRQFHIPAGTAAVRQGDAGESLFVIAEGVFDVQAAAPTPTDTEDGQRPGVVHLTRLRPGDLFGEMSLLTGQPRSASVVACTDAVVFELARSHLDPVLRRRPELAERLAEHGIRWAPLLRWSDIGIEPL